MRNLTIGKQLGCALPVISNQRMYELQTTHAGRRTFICNALLMGMPAEVVMKWTGHSDYKAMKPYIDVADRIKAEVMQQ